MLTFGSVCSGIEASQLAFAGFNYKQLWSSEIADFPSKVLEHHYPNIKNVGDMIKLPELIRQNQVEAPDLFCGGTPCQAFSLAGWKNGLTDERGQLTMTFIEIADAIDNVRLAEGKSKSIVLWENVEGVLNDKTNAFGNFIAGLAGFEEEIKVSKWTKSGYLEGPTRNVAWRVLDAKHFGLPQQRRRLYVLAGGAGLQVDQILFEFGKTDIAAKLKTTKTKKKEANKEQLNFFIRNLTPSPLPNDKVFYKNGVKIEVFREYTDCLYAAYGTKWNGNAAAYNGSLYISQDDRLRRLTPLECERLMGMPDNYTLVKGQRDTTRYQAIGNSWAVPVVEWIGAQINRRLNVTEGLASIIWRPSVKVSKNNLNATLILFKDGVTIQKDLFMNASASPNNSSSGNIQDIVDVNAPEKFYISMQGCKGILRRKAERNIKMNPQLERILTLISSEETILQAS